MSWPNRTLCDALTEMRECGKTNNYSYLDGLIEEVQSMVNRMEAKLSDFNDIKSSHEQKVKAEKELKEVSDKLKELKIHLPKEKED